MVLDRGDVDRDFGNPLDDGRVRVRSDAGIPSETRSIEDVGTVMFGGHDRQDTKLTARIRDQ